MLESARLRWFRDDVAGGEKGMLDLREHHRIHHSDTTGATITMGSDEIIIEMEDGMKISLRVANREARMRWIEAIERVSDATDGNSQVEDRGRFLCCRAQRKMESGIIAMSIIRSRAWSISSHMDMCEWEARVPVEQVGGETLEGRVLIEPLRMFQLNVNDLHSRYRYISSVVDVGAGRAVAVAGNSLLLIQLEDGALLGRKKWITTGDDLVGIIVDRGSERVCAVHANGKVVCLTLEDGKIYQECSLSVYEDLSETDFDQEDGKGVDISCVRRSGSVVWVGGREGRLWTSCCDLFMSSLNGASGTLEMDVPVKDGTILLEEVANLHGDVTAIGCTEKGEEIVWVGTLEGAVSCWDAGCAVTDCT